MADVFWSDLERVYAERDNARFDLTQHRKRQRRQERILVVRLSLAILSLVGLGSYVYGVVLFSSMPY